MRTVGYAVAILMAWIFVPFGLMTVRWAGIATLAMVSWYLIETFGGWLYEIRNDVREIKSRLR